VTDTDKRTSLLTMLWQLITTAKSFMIQSPGANVIKLYFVRNSRIFVIS